MPLNPETLKAMKEASEALKGVTKAADISHADPRFVNFIMQCNPANVSALIAERDQLVAANERLSDLARYCRHQLHDERLITDDEFASIVAQGPESARRLEGYDSLRAEVERQAQEIERLQAIERILNEAFD